ncbi:MAG: hypothetical protein RL326_1705 [Pseudomonadota bacterium]|jgi:hypothetical protein
MKVVQVVKVFCLGVLAVVGSACSSSTAPSEVPKPTVVEYQVRDVPGAVEYVWEEPMVDVVDVPPGLDPEGHYYRPGHQEVVEIRQGRWQYYKRPKK